MERIKSFLNFLTRNLETIVAGIISAAIWLLLVKIYSTFQDLLSAISKTNFFLTYLLFLVLAVGFFTIFYSFFRLARLIFITTTGHDTFGFKYSELVLIKDSDGAYLTESLSRQGGTTITWLLVQNGKIPVSDCRVTLENLKYFVNDEWVDAPAGFDRKALKWNVGYTSPEGKTNISRDESAELELARAVRLGSIKMEMSHLDGYSPREHLLVGLYKLSLRIDGQVLLHNRKYIIQPIHYEVVIDYRSTPNIEIKEVNRL